jgi:tetratricopeptide (TPR) repeat protein
MKALEPPHTHSVSAAEGWLGLGDLAEARAELERMGDSLQNHPDVLRVRWAIAAEECDWPAALRIARTLVRTTPESSFGWLHQAYALRRVPEGGIQAAWDSLLPALKTFPKIAIIPYNLACYACQLQQLDRARELLQRALATGNRNHIKQIAIEDSDLKPLWAEIRAL